MPEWVKDGFVNIFFMKRLFSLLFILAGVFSISTTSTAAPVSSGDEITHMTELDDNCTGSIYPCAVVTPDKNEQ